MCHDRLLSPLVITLLQRLVEEGGHDTAHDQGPKHGHQRPRLDLVPGRLHLHPGLAQQRALPFPVCWGFRKRKWVSVS